jgi:hypothetical protein
VGWPPESGEELAAVLTAAFEDAVADLMNATAGGKSAEVVETMRQRVLGAGRALASYAGSRYDAGGSDLAPLRELVLGYGPRLEDFN